MRRFWHILLLEARMTIVRKGFWLANCLVFLFYIPQLFGSTQKLETFDIENIWFYAAQMTFFTNLFLPVIAGIAAADRLVRDDRLGVNELLRSTSLRRWPYLLGKYFGVLLASLVPHFMLILILAFASIPMGAPWTVIPASVLAFIVVVVPAYAFVLAFSLVCPLIVPLRVYQVLFTGYWFWGNFLNPDLFPTLNGTLVTPVGKIALEGFYGQAFSVNGQMGPGYTNLEAVLNLVILGGCILAVLFAAERFYALRARNA